MGGFSSVGVWEGRVGSGGLFSSSIVLELQICRYGYLRRCLEGYFLKVCIESTASCFGVGFYVGLSGSGWANQGA